MDRTSRPARRRGSSRMPAESVFFERVVPLLLITLAAAMVAVIVLAVAAVLGLISL